MNEKLELRTVKVINYITPLREGGSLPAIAEADDGFLYVIKFRGAGQGTNALIADLIGAELARSIGLRVPELVFAELDEAFGRTEPDEEIQDLLRASTGLNLGIHFLSGAITYDPIVNKMDNEIASKILWLDMIISNVDRTVRNTNMLVWQKELWLIDHGAALYFHHTWDNWKEQFLKPVLNMKDHVLLPIATMLEKVDKEIKQLLPLETIREIVSLIPDSWLVEKNTAWTVEQKRDVYYQFLVNRINHSSELIKQVMHEP